MRIWVGLVSFSALVLGLPLGSPSGYSVNIRESQEYTSTIQPVATSPPPSLSKRTPFFGIHFRYYPPPPVRFVPIKATPFAGYYKLRRRKRRSEGSLAKFQLEGYSKPYNNTTPSVSTTTTTAVPSSSPPVFLDMMKKEYAGIIKNDGFVDVMMKTEVHSTAGATVTIFRPTSTVVMRVVVTHTVVNNSPIPPSGFSPPPTFTSTSTAILDPISGNTNISSSGVERLIPAGSFVGGGVVSFIPVATSTLTSTQPTSTLTEVPGVADQPPLPIPRTIVISSSSIVEPSPITAPPAPPPSETASLSLSQTATTTVPNKCHGFCDGYNPPARPFYRKRWSKANKTPSVQHSSSSSSGYTSPSFQGGDINRHQQNLKPRPRALGVGFPWVGSGKYKSQKQRSAIGVGRKASSYNYEYKRGNGSGSGSEGNKVPRMAEKRWNG
ncbi:hypothetical protein TWF694_003160 [Orbilia ellipsospora]|uniref:Uncharacterized protein n=1 Tax=Orbilia ellipsospora TaxID=2528407 RepID=A0AAV9X0R5_9PEZI